MDFLIYLITLFLLLLIGYVYGQRNEKKHYASLIEREAQYQHILLFNEKTPPPHVVPRDLHLVQGSVVISSDYFKTVAAALRNFFGGTLTSYESLLDRGRREAILRMKEDAEKKGANIIVNVLFTTSATQQFNAGVVSAEVLVYGTALTTVPEKDAASQRTA